MEMLKRIVVMLITWEARVVLWRTEPKIIAVTGSVGKTTTKDAIFAALSGSLHIRKSTKSFNSDIGVPLTILGLDNAWSDPIGWAMNIARGFRLMLSPGDYPAWLILEVGADRPGDIRRVAEWLRPDIAVITGVPEIPVHVEFFSSPEEVFKEKRSLAEHLKRGGKVVYNGEDERLRDLQNTHRGACVSYGLSERDDFFASHEEVMYADDVPVGIRFRVDHDGASVPITVSGALGMPRVYAATAALAVASAAGVDLVAAGEGIAAWEAPPGRLRIIPGHKGSVIIDDTYNSSPAAALAALDALRSVKARRRIAVMGDMLELGRYSGDAHRQVGERAAKSCGVLVTLGFRSRAIAEGAIEHGFRADRIFAYDQTESERAGKELRERLHKGDVILVKGSQGMRMEKTVKELMAEPDRAGELLVRMDDEWRSR